MSTPGSIILVEGTADAATPPAGKLTLFTKTDDNVYVVNSSGVVSQLGSPTPTPPGTNTNSSGQIQFNNGGSFGGAQWFQYDYANARNTGPLVTILGNGNGFPTLEIQTHNGGSINHGSSVFLWNDGGGGLVIQGGGSGGFDGNLQTYGSAHINVNLQVDADVKLGSMGANNLGFFGSGGTSQQLVTFSTDAPTPTAVSPTLTGVYATDYTALQTFNDAVVADIAALAAWAANEHTACQSVITALEAYNLVTD